MLYCPLDISCPYFLTTSIENLNEFEYELYLTEDDQSFTLPLNSKNEIHLTLNLPNLSDMVFGFNATIYSGSIAIKDISVNETIINPNMKITSTQEILSFNVPSNAKVKMTVQPISSTFVIFNYKFSELSTDITDIQMDITMTYTIDINSKKTFKVNQHDFYNSSLIQVNIKAENCFLNIDTVSTDIEIFSKSKDYYQLLFTEKKDYIITVSTIEKEQEKNKKCIFYTYAANNEHNFQMMIMEEVTYRIRLSDKGDPITLQFPFNPSDVFYQTSLNFEFYSEDKDTLVAFNINNLGSAQLYFWGYRVFPISIQSIKTYCVAQLTCLITIIVERFKREESYVDLKITANENVFQYISPNTMIGDKFYQNFTRIFYTTLNHNDKGKIKINPKTKGLNFDYIVINKNNISRNDILHANWTESSNYLIDEGHYLVDEECIDECYLFIRLQDLINTDTIMNYLIFIENNDHYIDAINNEKIKGAFDFDKNKYTFRFTMEDISKFEIIIGGSLVKYQFINVNSTVPCCDTFNDIYYPEEGSSFIDTVIGDGTTKYTITIDVVAISTNPDPYLSFYDITVMPFEYSNYPLNYINDGQIISCKTGKNTNYTYIFIKNDFLHTTYNYHFSFYGIQPKQFGFYYKCTFFLVKEQRVDIEKYVDHTSPYYSEFTGIVSQLSAFCFMLVETDIDTKFNLQISSQENELILIQNEKRLFVLEQEQNVKVKLIDNIKSLRDNYTYVLDIELLKGEGSITFITKEKLQGKRTMFLNSTILSQKRELEISSEYTSLLVNVKLSMISNEDYNQVKMINHTSLSNFVFYNNPFPLYFGLKLNKDINNLIATIRLRNSFSLYDTYYYKNLIFSAFYTDEESFGHYNNHQGELKMLKQISTHIPFNHPVIYIEELDSNILSQYPYLIIKVEKNITTKWSYSNIQFDIDPLITHKSEQSITLTERRYHYHKMISSYQLYLLNSLYPFVVIEFASCSDSTYQFNFAYKSGKEISKEKIEVYNEYGKEIRVIDNSEKLPIILNLTSTNKNKSVFIIKYTSENVKFEKNHFSFGNSTIQYFPGENKIASKWDTTKNNFYRNSTLNAIYYYYLYEYNNQSKSSICSPLSPLFFNLTTNDYYNWTNHTIPYSKIDNIIVAYLSLDDEDFLVGYNPIPVDIISASSFWFWTILVFVVVLLLVLYGTYAIYKEIKKNEEIEESQEEMVINKKRKNKSKV